MSHNIKSKNKRAGCNSLARLLKDHGNWLWLVIMGSLFAAMSAQARTITYVPNPDNYSVSVMDAQTNIRMAALPTGGQAYITDPWLGVVANYEGTVSYLASPDSGDGSLITINFDIYPNNARVVEGTIITDQYADAGVIFGIADSSFGTDASPVIEDASAGVDTFIGMSVPNFLTFHGYVPGGDWSMGCNTDLKISFIDPLTKQSAKVQSGSMRIFASAFKPPSTIKLVARNAEGLVIDQNEFLVSSFLIEDSFILSVAAASASIATIETQGSTGNDVCLAFDNLVVSRPINDRPVAGDVTLVSSGELVNWNPQVSDAISGPQPLTCRIASQPANGIATVSADCANGTYQPNPGFVGTDTFTYLANDGNSDSNLGTVSVAVKDTLIDIDCLLQYPVSHFSQTGKQGTLTVRFTGNIVSYTNKAVKVCPGTTLSYQTTSTQGPVVCQVKNNTTRGSGSLNINNHLKCTDKPAGQDKVHFKVKSGVK